MTVRASNDFTISIGECDALNDTGCGSFSPTWSSTSSLSLAAFIYMDAASGVNLPTITSPANAFDSAKYYHDLHVVPSASYPACDPTCLTT